MGLAAQKTKQRFGLDPRNTNWSNDTERFGTKYLKKLGWTPGGGLGLVSHATTSHVKVALKDDRVGLGAKLAKKHKNADMNDDIVGLDVFQRILGKLNGKEDEISSELDRQRKQKIIEGKWGIAFIKAETMKSTWDAERKKFLDGSEDLKPSDKKRLREQGESDANLKENKRQKTEDIEKIDKKKKKEKKEKKQLKDKKKHFNEDDSDNKEESSKKDKKDKKDKSEKIEGKLNSNKGKEGEMDLKEKKYKKDKKDKKDKAKKFEERKEKFKKENEDNASDSGKKDVLTEHKVASRLAARSRYIQQKRRATMDAKALNEIFMIAN